MGKSYSSTQRYSGKRAGIDEALAFRVRSPVRTPATATGGCGLFCGGKAGR